MSGDSTDLILYTTKHCAPCVAMKRKLEEVKKIIPFTLKTIDLEDLPVEDLGAIRVAPVLKIVGNNEHIVGDVDMDSLQSALFRSLYSSMIVEKDKIGN